MTIIATVKKSLSGVNLTRRDWEIHVAALTWPYAWVIFHNLVKMTFEEAFFVKPQSGSLTSICPVSTTVLIDIRNC